MPYAWRHLLAVVVGFKGHVLGFGRRLHLVQQRAQREADPRHDNGPPFRAAVPVDALFERSDLVQTVQVESFRLGHFAFHLQRPGRGAEVGGVFGGVALVGAELIEVVVMCDDFERRQFILADVVGGLLDVGQLRAGARRSRQRAKCAHCEGACQETSPVNVHLLGSDVRITKIGGFSYQHRLCFYGSASSGELALPPG